MVQDIRMRELNSFPRIVAVKEIIEIVTSEGKGTEEEPVRMVRYYFSPNGEFLARYDAIRDNLNAVSTLTVENPT